MVFIHVNYATVLLKIKQEQKNQPWTLISISQERHHYLMEFEFKPEQVPLSLVFKTMERGRGQLPILDYSVSQNTLDNVGTTKTILYL